MAKLNDIPLLALLSALPLVLFGGGCVSETLPQDGTCTVVPAMDCTVAPLFGTAPQDVGLVGYSCSGTARPDENAHYVQDVPSGTVCADRGTTADGQRNYCCSSAPGTCALDPALPCEPGNAGYQCNGTSRPEAYNAALQCGNGVEDGVYDDYCCTGQPQPPSCTPTDGIGCDGRLTGFNCPPGALPKGEDLGSSESRADYFRLLCPTATRSSNQSRESYNFCCYMPAPPMTDFSCVQDATVPGCAPGRFGFACYGYDTPPEDYPPMACPDPSFAGKSAEGYPANLYCCDFMKSVSTP